jgi:small-conductance mechanosensitive channel
LTMFDATTGDYKTETAREARKIAARLFRWLKPPNRDYLMPGDLAPYLDDPEDMKRALNMFRGRRLPGLAEIITENDMRRGLDQLLQDRCGLAKSMQSIETALDKINLLLTAVFSFLLIICFVLLFSDVGKLLQALASLFGAAAFIFSTTATHLFESVIFLLVIHPFDVGDRVYIPLSTTGPLSPTGETGLDNLVVVEMHVLSTIFERWDGIRVYVQNHILATKPIFNIRRSGPIRDFLRLQVSFDTPLEKLNQLRRKLEGFVQREANDFNDFSLINVEYLENCNKLGLQIIIIHKTNWQDMELHLARRNKVLMFMRGALDELVISYSLPVQRVQLHGDISNSLDTFRPKSPPNQIQMQQQPAPMITPSHDSL